MTRRFSKPVTLCDRLLNRDDMSEEMKRRLRQNRTVLDPVSLLHSIRKSMDRLNKRFPYRYSRRQPRTLQRRVRQ